MVGYDAISTVQRAFNWAAKRGHIGHSPIRGFDEKPSRSRPIEDRTLQSHHVDLVEAIAIFPLSKSTEERNERVIFLPDAAVDLYRRRIESQDDGHILRNSDGEPWTKDAIILRFKRLSKDSATAAVPTPSATRMRQNV